jgi:hypothetical protein
MKIRRRLDERAAVVEFEHRHLRNPALGQIAGGFTSPLARSRVTRSNGMPSCLSRIRTFQALPA